MKTESTAPGPALPPAIAWQRNVIVVALVGLAAAGWLVFLEQTPDEMAMDDRMGPDLTMGGSWPIFAGTWVAMMVAMMFPAAAPMVAMYGRMRRNDPLSISLFTGTYLAMWISFGAVAYLLSVGVESAATRWDWIAMHWGRAGGVLLVLAGAYQITPLKDICLRHCRTPLSFVMGHWRDGRAGAIRMGVRHGTYCMGCCWMLFLILIPLGMMNVAAMAAVALLVFIEKVAPWGRGAGLAVGAVMAVAGGAVVLSPGLLPTVSS